MKLFLKIKKGCYLLCLIFKIKLSLLRLLYKVAIDADSVARAIAFAIEQPADVAINELIVRPTVQVG